MKLSTQPGSKGKMPFASRMSLDRDSAGNSLEKVMVEFRMKESNTLLFSE